MKNAMNKRAAESTYQKVNTYLKNLEMHLNSLNMHIEEMNETVWHGGENANTWYETANDICYVNDVAFRNGVTQLQEELKKYITEK